MNFEEARYWFSQVQVLYRQMLVSGGYRGRQRCVFNQQTRDARQETWDKKQEAKYKRQETRVKGQGAKGKRQRGTILCLTQYYLSVRDYMMLASVTLSSLV